MSEARPQRVIPARNAKPATKTVAKRRSNAAAKTGALALTKAKRDAAMAQMRMTGATLEDIGKKFGVNRSTALRGIRSVIQSIVTAPAEELRQKHYDRLETLIEANQDAAIEQGDDKAAGVVLKAMGAEADLLGLNAPKTIHNEISGPGGGPIQSQVITILGQLSDEQIQIIIRDIEARSAANATAVPELGSGDAGVTAG